MPAGRRPGVRARPPVGSSLGPAETVVRGDDDGRARPVGQGKQAAEKSVHLPEVAPRHVAIAGEVVLRHRGLARGRERCEDVADRIGPLQVDQCQVVGGRVGEQRLGHAAIEARFDQDPSQRRDRMVVGARDSGVRLVFGLGQPGQIVVHRGMAGGPLDRRPLGDGPRRARLGEDRAGRRLGLDVEKAEQAIRDDDAVDRLSGVCRPEPQEPDPLAGPGERVPDRRRAPVLAADRFAQPRAGSETAEIENAVLDRRDSGEHRRPEQRRERRNFGFELAPGCRGAQAREMRHCALREERLQLLPVAAIESDEEDRRPGGRAPRELVHRARSARIRL